MQISQFFVNGDIKGAIAYMRDHEEFKDMHGFRGYAKVRQEVLFYAH